MDSDRRHCSTIAEHVAAANHTMINCTTNDIPMAASINDPTITDTNSSNISTTTTFEMETCYSSRNMQSKLIPIIVRAASSRRQMLPPLPTPSSSSSSSSLTAAAASSSSASSPTPAGRQLNSDSDCRRNRRQSSSWTPPPHRLQSTVDVRWPPMRNAVGCLRWTIAVSLLLCSLFATCCALEPDFVIPLENVTIAQGRDATFTCVVNNLGGYRVAWIKADAKAILAIHEHVITNNDRLSVTHNDYNTWTLVIRNVKMEDRGQYMCQVNTDPMKMQTAFLEVVIPPDIMYEETSGDMMVPEGSSAKLICKARGYPKPKITWRREDGREIIARSGPHGKTKTLNVEGELLWLSKVTRSEMGAYLCIASNGVPPSVSKRMKLQVHFHPLIQVPNQLVGAPVDTDVTLVCNAEASPKAINYWQRENGEMIIPNERYAMTETDNSMYAIQMVLVIRRLQKSDFGGYKCISKNSIGGIEATIRLYEMELTKKKAHRHNNNDDDGKDSSSTSVINELGEVESSVGTSAKNKNGRFFKGLPSGGGDTYDDSTSRATTARRQPATAAWATLMAAAAAVVVTTVCGTWHPCGAVRS